MGGTKGFKNLKLGKNVQRQIRQKVLKALAGGGKLRAQPGKGRFKAGRS